MIRPQTNARILSRLMCLCAFFGCERTTELVSSRRVNQPDAAQPEKDAAPPHDASPPWSVADAGTVLCGDAPCACANGIDDDQDGLIDGFDPECTGPFDQDEGTFATGEEKGGNPNCDDCFFDGNPGFADDGCRIAAVCAYEGSAENASPACSTCNATPLCVNNCLPRTPNGCDCFGCCEVAREGASFAIKLVDSCSLADLSDVQKCPRCTVNRTCFNPCGRCELCPGKTRADLPADCAQSGPGFRCDDGTVCTSDADCGSFAYCVQGCCAPIVL